MRWWPGVSSWRLLGTSALFTALYGGGECCQQLMRGEEQLDPASIARIAAVGGCLVAPWSFNWFRVLERLLPGTSLKRVLQKVLCDQLIAGPVGLTLFYVGTSVAERRDNVFLDLKEKGFATYKVGCMMWPPVQTINFIFVPTHLRPVYVGCFQFGWTNFLCYMKHKGIPERRTDVSEVFAK